MKLLIHDELVADRPDLAYLTIPGAPPPPRPEPDDITCGEVDEPEEVPA